MAGSLALVFAIGDVATGVAVSIAAAAILFLRAVEFGRTAMFLGSMSYSLYLVHVPIGGRVVNLLKRFDQGAAYELVVVALALLASLVAAMMLHRFVEAPAIVASRKIGQLKVAIPERPRTESP